MALGMKMPQGRPKLGAPALKRLEGNDRARVHDAGDGLHLFADEVADIRVFRDVEFGQNVVIAGDGIDLGGDSRLA